MESEGIFPVWLSNVSFAGRRTNVYKKAEDVLRRHGVDVLNWGGQVKAERPDALLIDDATVKDPPKKVDAAIGFRIPVIKVEWVMRCEAEGRMLSYKPHQYSATTPQVEEEPHDVEAPRKPTRVLLRRRSRVLDESSSEPSEVSSPASSSEGTTPKARMSASPVSDIEGARGACVANSLPALKFPCDDDDLMTSADEAERLLTIHRRAQAQQAARGVQKRSRSQLDAPRRRPSVSAPKKTEESGSGAASAPDPWSVPWWERSKNKSNKPPWGSNLQSNGERAQPVRGRQSVSARPSVGRPSRPAEVADKDDEVRRAASPPCKKRRKTVGAVAPASVAGSGSGATCSSTSGVAVVAPPKAASCAGKSDTVVESPLIPAPGPVFTIHVPGQGGDSSAFGGACTSLAARRRSYKEKKLQAATVQAVAHSMEYAAPVVPKAVEKKVPAVQDKKAAPVQVSVPAVEKKSPPTAPQAAPVPPPSPPKACAVVQRALPEPVRKAPSLVSPLSPTKPAHGRHFDSRPQAAHDAAPPALKRTTSMRGGRPSVSASNHVDKAAEKRKKGGKDYERPWLNGAKSAKKAEDEPQVDHILKTLKEHELTKNLPQDLVTALRHEILDPQQLRENGITFEDVQGLEDAKKTLNRSVILPRTNPKLFRGLRQPVKGLLLFGPPGNGKTMLAKAVAAQCNLTFFNISASALTSKMVGDGEKNVKALFACARALAPSFVFLDEIDSLLTSRGGGGSEHESSRRLKTEFLVQLDGAGAQNDGVLVMAATNRPMDLDDAVLRRLEKRVFVPLPNKETRLQYCKRTLTKDVEEGMVHLDFDDDTWNVLAESTENYSFCDLSNLCRELALAPLDDCEDLEHADVLDLRPINVDDVKRQIQEIRESVSQDLLRQLVAWNEKFGSKSQT